MDLGNLQTIGGDAYFNDSQITDLGNLTTIEGDAYFEDSEIMDLGNLQTIGGRADFGDREDLQEEWERRQNKYKKGGRTISQTPAPKKDRVYGSEKNKPKSSTDTKSAEKITFSEKTLESIEKKVNEHNKAYPNKKITLASAKAVVRRGMGAYSSTHRPTISGGKPNSRVAWGLARLNAFIYKIINGKSKSGKYSQDNDLIEELGYKVDKYEIGGIFQGTPHDFDKYSTEYIGTGEGHQVFGWGLYFTDLKDVAKYYMSAGLEDEEAIKFDGKSLSKYDIEQEVKDQLVGIVNTIFREDKLIPTIPLIKDYLVLEYDKENYPEFKELVEQSIKTWNFIKDKKISFSGNIYSVTLFKGKDEGHYELLEWEKKPKKSQLDLIKKQLDKEGIIVSRDLGIGKNNRFKGEYLYKILEEQETSYTGGTKNNNLYTELSAFLGGDKEASLFLLRAGIDGIKYKAGTLSGFEGQEGYNYVIFNGNDVTIEGKEKYADGGLVGNTFTEIIYFAILSTETTTDIYAQGNDLDKIKSEYDSISASDFDNPNSNYNSKILESRINKYEFIGDDTLNAEDYIDDLENTDYWNLIDEDIEYIDSDSVLAINNSTDEMIDKIREFIKQEYNIGGRYAEKYMSINIYDENEDYINDLQIRIADHSQNPKNNRNDYTLSFVIANNNPTENKFYPFGEEYYYDDNADIEDIKEEIKVIIDEKIEYIKENGKNYADGGDIQAYEEAMGISYAEGGEAKPKKVYVSIQLPYDIEKLNKKDYSTTPEYFYSYNEKPFEELKNGVLIGVVGVSSSPNNIAEWFIHRDCLIVMNYDEFMAINETETINYYDPYQLMKNNLYLFKRLYANITRYGEQEGSYVFTQTLVQILEKMIREINLEMNLAEGQKSSELYRISRFLSPYETKAFPNWIEKNKIKIESPIDLTNAILDFNKLNDNWLGNGFPNSVLTFDELLPIVEKGVTNASKIYESEQEIVLTNRELNIPKNSQLFFVGKDELGNKRESNKDELIEKYNLKELYKVYFVNAKEIQKYRDFWLKKEEEKFNKKIETGKQDLEIKKSQVTNQLIDYFIQHSIDTVIDKVNKEILSYELGSLEFYDSTKDDYEEMNWVNIPLVNELFSKYTEIVEKSWEEIIENKSVNEVNLYSFNVFQDDAHRKLKTYFEQNREKYEELNNYKNIKGRPSLDLSMFKYDMLKSLYDYENLPEWIDYKELSKMYLKRMGSEIYRYYDKKDLPLISYYKQGGGVLLAPNGKPSNLTPEQYKLVREPAFKQWFGDWENNPENASKVVDENGEPKVVWRGESKDFNKFDYKKLGSRLKTAWRKAGFYFAPTKSSAEQYMFFMGTRILKEFFLNIRNPYTLDSSEFYGVMDWGSLPNQRFKTNKSATDYANSQVEIIKSKNHDGFFVTILEDDNIVEIVAFEPNQIKLANGTNTTFDNNNPDIRYTGGGGIEKVKFDIEEDDEEQRITISIKNIGKVILVVTYPEYEFLEDIGEDGLEELGVEEGDMIGKIEHLEIENKYKGQGYAKLLMNKAIEVAKEKGLMPLYLNASPMGFDGLDIDALTIFYEKLGFQVFLEQGGNNLMILKETYNNGGLMKRRSRKRNQ